MPAKKTIKVTKCPPGPDNVHFQEYAWDDYTFGYRPGVHKASDFYEEHQSDTLAGLMVNLHKVFRKTWRMSPEMYDLFTRTVG
jgi:hypothetical protein